MIRLFAALSLPGDTRAALEAWGARAVGRDPVARLIGIDALHVTLVFLGNVAEDQIDVISAAVVSAARPVGSLSVTGAAWLPPRRPGVLVADLSSDEHLTALHRDLVEALRPWHEPETRGLRPHVTVARVRRGQTLASTDVPDPPALIFEPSALVLYRSHMGPGGASYEALASAPL